MVSKARGAWCGAVLAAAVAAAALAACEAGGRERTVFAKLERTECEGTAPCLRIRDQFGGDWGETAAIEGFTAEDGYMYQVRVRDQDGRLTWLETVERTRTAAPEYKSGNAT